MPVLPSAALEIGAAEETSTVRQDPVPDTSRLHRRHQRLHAARKGLAKLERRKNAEASNVQEKERLANKITDTRSRILRLHRKILTRHLKIIETYGAILDNHADAIDAHSDTMATNYRYPTSDSDTSDLD
ncbi:hypothetical protein OQA88_8461 [Cercophora sp. LCS_1]